MACVSAGSSLDGLLADFFSFDPLTLEAGPRNLDRKWASAQLPLQVYAPASSSSCCSWWKKRSSSTAAAASVVRRQNSHFFNQKRRKNLIWFTLFKDVSEFLDLRNLCDLLWPPMCVQIYRGQLKYRQEVQLIWNQFLKLSCRKWFPRVSSATLA